MGDPAGPNYFFADPEGHQAGRTPELSTQEKSFYSQMGTAADDPARIFVYGNREPDDSRGAVYASPRLAKGYSAALSSEMPLSRFVDREGDTKGMLFSSRWFSHVAVMQIPDGAIPTQMRERDMSELIKGLAHDIDGLERPVKVALGGPVTVPDDIKTRNIIWDAADRGLGRRDNFWWKPTLAGHGHFAGLYKENVTLAGGAARQPSRYYLAVHADSNEVGDALNQYALLNPDMTLGEFSQSPAYLATQSYSNRNARRLLAVMSDTLRLDTKRSILAREPDRTAARGPNNEAAPDLISKLYAHSTYNELTRLMGNTMLYNNTTVRLAYDQETSGRIVQLRNARAGISIVTLNEKTDYLAPRFGGKETAQENLLQTFPVGSGRYAVDKHGLSDLTHDDARILLSTYHWRGKQPGTPDAPSSYEKDFSSAPRQLYRYRKPDAEQSMLHQLMTAGAPRLDLVPVAVVLSHDGSNEK